MYISVTAICSSRETLIENDLWPFMDLWARNDDLFLVYTYTADVSGQCTSCIYMYIWMCVFQWRCDRVVGCVVRVRHTYNLCRGEWLMSEGVERRDLHVCTTPRGQCWEFVLTYSATHNDNRLVVERKGASVFWRDPACSLWLYYNIILICV